MLEASSAILGRKTSSERSEVRISAQVAFTTLKPTFEEEDWHGVGTETHHEVPGMSAYSTWRRGGVPGVVVRVPLKLL